MPRSAKPSKTEMPVQREMTSTINMPIVKHSWCPNQPAGESGLLQHGIPSKRDLLMGITELPKIGDKPRYNQFISSG